MIGVAVAALAAAGVGAYTTGMLGGDQVAVVPSDVTAPVETSAVSNTQVPSTEVETAAETSEPAEPVQVTSVEVVETDPDASSEALPKDGALAGSLEVARVNRIPNVDGSSETIAPDAALEGALAVDQARVWPDNADQVLQAELDEIEASTRVWGAPETSLRPAARETTNTAILAASIEEEKEAVIETTPLTASLVEEEDDLNLAEASVEPETASQEIAAILLPETPSPAPEARSAEIEPRLIDLNSQDGATSAALPVSPQTPNALEADVTSRGVLATLPPLPATPAPSISTQVATLADFQPLTLPASLTSQSAGLAEDLALDLPESNAGWTRSIIIEAPEIGFELQPEPAPQTSQAPAEEGEFVLSNWNVSLPFRDLRADEDGNLWIRSVEGIPVQRRDDLIAVLKEMFDLSGVEEISLNLGLGPRNGDAILDQVLTLPVTQETALPNGLRFESRAEGREWVTRVTNVPTSLQSDFKAGDQLVAFVPTGERIDGRMSLPDLLMRELLAGQNNYSFAVDRDGTVWLASMTYSAAAQN
jgi:hypothetical protein